MLSPVDIPSILNERQKWRKENPLYLVRLNSAQKRFMDCVTQDGKLPRRLIFCGCNKIGKAQRSVEPTPTPNGIVPFGSLQVGDKVFSQDGSITTVTGVYPQGYRPMCKLRFTDGSWTIADLDHLWECTTPKERFRAENPKSCVMTTRQLMETQDKWDQPFYRFSMPVAQPLQFPKRDLLVDPYVVGLWFSEGNTAGSVTLSLGDFDLVDILKKRWPELTCTQLGKSSWVVRLLGAMPSWRELGLAGCVSYNKRIPNDYLFGSIDQRLELLRGILDGDGCIVPKGSVNGVEYSTASPYLAKAVKWLVQSLGGQVTVKLRRPWFTYKGERKKGKRSFRLFLSGLTMCPFKLKRKAKSWRPRESRTNQRVLRSITYWGEDEAVCIQVEHPSQLYLTRNCIVTHNTTMGAIRGTCLAIGEHPFLRDNHVFRDLRKSGWPLPNVGLVAGETLTQTINQKLAPEYLKWIPKVCEPTFKRNSLGVITEITIHKDLKGQPLGSKIFMRCYSEDTEVLTQDGWKLFKDVSSDDPVMTMRLSDGVLEWQKPIAQYSYDYSGTMYGTKHRNLDYLVTPSHNMVIQNYGRSNKYTLRPAVCLQRRDSVPRRFGWEGASPAVFRFSYRGTEYEIPYKDWLGLVGLALSEGYANTVELAISQYDGLKKDRIRALLDRLPFKYTEGPKGFRIYSRELAADFAWMGLSGEKHIPEKYKNLSSDLLRELLYWMALGDGTVWNGKQGDVERLEDFREYTSKSKRLVDDYQECLLKVGLNGTVRSVTGENVYRCSILTSDRITYSGGEKMQNGLSVEVPYSGKVYCLEVPNHTLMTRRNGRTLISGNSYDSQADTYEGIDYNWIHWDEPPPNNVFVAAERGLIAMNGISYLTFTSLKEPWLNDLAAESIDYGGEDATVRVIESGDIWNALKENGGHLEREAIEAFIKVCPVEEYDARILGKWMESGGRIYGTFRDAFPYVLPPFEIPNDWQWYESVDPADGKHTKWLFVAVAPYDVSIFKQNVGRLFVADWLSFPPGTLITDMVKMVKRKRIELDYEEPSMVVLDAKFGRRRTTAFDRNEPQRWDEKLIEAGVGYVKLSHSAPGDVDVGHNVVREYLKPQLWSFAMQEDAQEVPGLVFFSTCRGKGGPIEAMLKYKRQMKSDKPEETYKDWPDAIRYVCMEYPKVMRIRTKRASSESGKPRNRFTGV